MNENQFTLGADVQLTDHQWDAIKDLFDCRRKRKHSIREVIDAILYVFDNDIHWRMLPKSFAPWQTVYYYYDKWRKTGVWQNILHVLPEDLRVKIITSSHTSPYPNVQVHVLKPRPFPKQAQIHTIDIKRERPARDYSSYSWVLRNFLADEPSADEAA